MSTLFETGNLSVSYNGGAVLHGASVSLAKGQVVGIVGESGSGKTTLMRAALDFLGQGGTVDSGSIRFAGKDPLVMPPKERRAFLSGIAGFVPQSPQHSFSPVRTIGSQFSEVICQKESFSRERAREYAVSLLGKLGFARPVEVLDSYLFELSGGMAQRASIGLALAGKPRVLFADEPTSALDVAIQAQVVSELMRVNKEFDTSLLVISHNIAVMAHMASYLYVMKDGRIVEEGPTAQVIGNPCHEYTRALISSVPRMEGFQ